jgi:hypothetical protein
VAPNQKQPYFGLTLGAYPGGPKNAKPVAGDGLYHRGVVVIRWHGGAWDLNGWVRIRLWSNRTGGSFSGRAGEYPHRKVAGSFKC